MPALSSINLTKSAEQKLRQLVWLVLENTTKNHRALIPKPNSSVLLKPHACFVTLYVDKKLRGCIGTYTVEKSLWQNVYDYTYYSACQDHRFQPIQKHELANISFEISILSALQEIENIGEQALLQQLRVGIDGLLLKESTRHAIFLPSVWSSLRTPASFLQELKLKGGWKSHYWSAGIQLFRFTTVVITNEESFVKL